MRNAMAWTLLSVLVAASQAMGQDAPEPAQESIQPELPLVESATPPEPYDRPVSWKEFIPNMASDQKNIWLFPLKLRKKSVLIPTAAIVAATAALVALDRVDTPYFRRTSSFGGFNRVFNGNLVAEGILGVPAALYLTGMPRKDSKMKSTALLAAEALADTELLATAMKDVDRRLRPIAISPHGNFAHTWFDDNSHDGFSNGSFPSGHEIAAFSVATVVARRYGNHRWLPYVAYGLAGVIGFSRVTLLAHFPSDVFAGAALGYSIARFDVLRQ